MKEISSSCTDINCGNSHLAPHTQEHKSPSHTYEIDYFRATTYITIASPYLSI